jgi:hypothetical protein
MSTVIKPQGGRLVVKSINDLDLNLLSNADAALYVQGGQYIDGHLYVGGTLIANGDVITLGNANGSLALNANIPRDVIPSTTKLYDLGSSTNVWKQLNIQTVTFNKTQETSNISATASLSAIDATTGTALVLADGEEGMEKIITVAEAISNNVIVTPTNGAGFTSITFTSHGDTARLIFVGGAWNILSHFRSSINV